MYYYVEKEQVKRYKSYCRNVLDQLRTKLKEKYAIESKIVLIGSGAEDMVTKNGKGPFDLDYNLILTSIPQKYEDSPGLLKNVSGRYWTIWLMKDFPMEKAQLQPLHILPIPGTEKRWCSALT